MLDETHPDGVFIVVSHFETVRVTTGCLQRGYPCLVEKPAGFTSKETAEMARLAEQYNCLSMVGVNRRYISSLHYGLAEILQRGPLFGITVEAPEAIRRIRNTQGHLSEEIYDRWLVGNSIHAIDLLRCLGGDVHSIVGFKNAREEVNGDSFASVMRFSHGGLGTFTAHWNSAGAWIVVLYGEGIRVNITLGNIPQGEVQLAKKRFVLPINPIDILYKPGLYAQNQAFVNALANGENLRWPASDLSDATKTMQLIEQIAMAH
jgi:predicted dehydrogenase